MNKVMDIISRMQQLEGVFSKREQLVADYILANLGDVSHQSQNMIAQGAGVSVATVNRFCGVLGFEGFREFQISLAQNVAVSVQYFNVRDGGHYTEADQLVNQVFGALLDGLNLARQQLESDLMQQAIDKLANANRIVFMGVGGGSANVAQEGANRFFRLGIPSEAHSDGYFQRMVASTLGRGDVVFLISASGQPTELLDSVKIARQYGASSICLTRVGSELAQISDICLGVDVPEDQDIYKPSASRLVYMAIVDVLAAGAARHRPELAKDYLRRIRLSLLSLSPDTSPKPIGD